MSATMNAATIDKTGASLHRSPLPPAPRRFHGLGKTGFVIVAIVALITSMNTTAKFLVTLPIVKWASIFVADFAVHLFIGTAILLAAVWARNRFPRVGASQYLVAFVAVTFATAAALLVIAALQTHGTFGSEDPEWQLWDVAVTLASDLVRYAFVGLIITSAWLYLRTDAEHTAALEQCAVDSARMDQQTAEARLQMLEAQIEPHFLFNTLAHVKRLYETDRTAGARMMENLKDYLAVALPQMRETESTLGREIDHVTAYLNIQQIRMGRRLAFAIDVPADLWEARLPPLMLLTLVENAVKHGLSPLPEGGRIDVHASSENGRLRIQVADTGQGFAKTGGGGTGLANIRARLVSQFGASAKFSLALGSPRGVVATLALPHQSVVAARSDA
jgi:signal transduction histidine kinase